jgi:DNA-binding transcriptional ArsR family regulator
MEDLAAADALAALGHPHRLKVFRLLMARAPAGVPAGEIARALAMAPASLSFHLSHLERAGLLRASRVARNVFYAVDLEGTRRLVAFLTEDCCQGHPQICGYPRRDAGCAPKGGRGSAPVDPLRDPCMTMEAPDERP